MKSAFIPASILAYFGLVLLYTLPFWALGFLVPSQLLPGLPISALAVLAPAAAALTLAYRSGGVPALTGLLRRCLDAARVRGAGWYLLIIMANPLIALATYYGLIRAANPALPPLARPGLGTLPLFLFFLVGGLAEELGWTAWATPPLLERFGVLRASLLLGAFWAAWHFIALMQAGRAWEWIAWWSLGTLSQRLLMTWIYSRSGGSLFAAALFHALINLCWQLFPVSGSFYDPAIFAPVTLALAILLLAAARLAQPRHTAAQV